MIKWEKPNGQEIETNDRNETVEYCESIGWIRCGSKKEVKQEETEEAPKRRGRPPKED